jgi:hypothetical protein
MCPVNTISQKLAKVGKVTKLFSLYGAGYSCDRNKLPNGSPSSERFESHL